MFTMSKFASLIWPDGKFLKEGGILSYATASFMPLGNPDIQLLSEGAPEQTGLPVQQQLLAAEALFPEGADEFKIAESILTEFEKCTIWVTPLAADIEFAMLHQFLLGKKISTLVFMMAGWKDELLSESVLKQLKRSADNVLAGIPVIKYMTVTEADAGNSICIAEYSFLTGRLEKNVVHRQYMGYGDAGAVSEGSSLINEKSTTGYSVISESQLPEIFDKRICRLRSTSAASLVASECSYIKELPLSGLVVDAALLPQMQTLEIHPDCRSCKLLKNCGGFTAQVKRHCPSYSSWSEVSTARWIELAAEKTQLAVFSSAGVSNSLSLNTSINILFDRAIEDNTTPKQRLLVNFLNHQYNNAFTLSREGNLRKAGLVFHLTECSYQQLIPDGFCQYWVQTFATSTKSYYAYKNGGYVEAVTITCQGIESAFILQAGRSCAVISLYIAQMFLNLAKVYLVAGQFELWQSTMLQNIHYLINFQCPAGFGGSSANALKEVPADLRQWLLMECVGQVIKFNLTYKEQAFGHNLLLLIDVKDTKVEFNRIFAEWVRLNKVIDYNDGVDYSDWIKDFTAACGDRQIFNPLKSYLRLKSKRSLKVNYRNHREETIID